MHSKEGILRDLLRAAKRGCSSRAREFQSPGHSLIPRHFAWHPRYRR